MDEFTQLANGDIWLPPQSREGLRPDTASAAIEEVPDARDEAIKAAQSDPLRPNITCPWCQQDFPDEEIFNGHVRLNHALAIGLSAEAARTIEEGRIVRERAQARVEAREGSSADQTDG